MTQSYLVTDDNKHVINVNKELIQRLVDMIPQHSTNEQLLIVQVQ